MTPQSHFVVVAAIAPGREAALRKLLETMNAMPGMADPANAVLPFGAFPRLHFARFAVLGDETMADLEVFGLPRPKLPTYLVFMGDCDGPADGAERGGFIDRSPRLALPAATHPFGGRPPALRA